MVSIRDNVHGTLINMRESLDIFSTPYETVKVIKDTGVYDITKHFRRMNLFGAGCTTSKKIYIERFHQIYHKERNKIYIIWCSLYELLYNKTLLPSISIMPPRKQLLNDYTVYINNSPLTVDERIILRKHDKNNFLEHVYNFNNMTLTNVTIHENDRYLKDFNDKLNILTIKDIYVYL